MDPRISPRLYPLMLLYMLLASLTVMNMLLGQESVSCYWRTKTHAWETNTSTKACQNQIRTDDRIKMIYAFFAILVKAPVDTEGRTLKEELLVYMLAFLSFSIGGGIKTTVRISGTTASRSWKTYEDHCSRISDMGLLCLVRNKIIPKHPQTHGLLLYHFSYDNCNFEGRYTPFSHIPYL